MTEDHAHKVMITAHRPAYASCVFTQRTSPKPLATRATDAGRRQMGSAACLYHHEISEE